MILIGHEAVRRPAPPSRRSTTATGQHLRRTYAFSRNLLVHSPGQSFVVRSVGSR